MKTETYLYEILIRGLPDGKIGGAHILYMDRYIADTGEFLVEKPAQPTSIDISQIQSILGSEMAAALMQVPQATADRDKAIAEKDAAVTSKNSAIEACTKSLIEAIDSLNKLKASP